MSWDKRCELQGERGVGGRGVLKGQNIIVCLGRMGGGPGAQPQLADPRGTRGSSRSPYTWWVPLALLSLLWDPSLIRISERNFSLEAGLSCRKQGGKRREKYVW